MARTGDSALLSRGAEDIAGAYDVQLTKRWCRHHGTEKSVAVDHPHFIFCSWNPGTSLLHCEIRLLGIFNAIRRPRQGPETHPGPMCIYYARSAQRYVDLTIRQIPYPLFTWNRMHAETVAYTSRTALYWGPIRKLYCTLCKP